MRPISRAEFVGCTSHDAYYRNRWPYLEVAISMVRSLEPQTALEVGPWKCPILVGSDTMDNRVAREDVPPTHLFDAGKTPWPIVDKAYDVTVALQVWEHLDGRQADAFRELMRVSRSAVLSFPLGWDVPGDPIHHAISRDQIRTWTCNVPMLKHCVVGGRSKRPRIVCLWRFT